jgi:putative phage-type endonuclease
MCTDAKAHAAFLAERRTGVGGSDAVVVLGLSPYATPFQLWAQKLGLTTDDDSATESEWLWWGRKIEPLLMERWQLETNRVVVPHHNAIHLRHPEADWMTCHLDGEELDQAGARRGIVECKNVVVFRASNWQDQPPIEVQVQVQHNMAVAGTDTGVAIALLGGNQMAWCELPRNQQFIDGLMEREYQFWQRVQQDDPPTVVARDSKFLNTLWAPKAGTTVALGDPGAEWHRRRDVVTAKLAVARKRLRKLEKEREEVEAHIKAAIRDNEAGQLPDGTLYTYKEVNRKGYTVDPTSYRQLRLVQTKEDTNGK